MFKRLERFAPQVLGLTRILFGTMLACHGAQKLLGAFGGTHGAVPTFIIGIAGPIELVGGTLIAVGLFTRYAAFLVSGMMAVAYFMAHAPKGFWPILNGGELAIVYCWLAFYLFAQGPGAFALDNLCCARSHAAPRATPGHEDLGAGANG